MSSSHVTVFSALIFVNRDLMALVPSLFHHLAVDCSLLQVHIQQVGQRELKRAPLLTQKAAEHKRREKLLLEKASLSVHL
jgi:hypothetical protein